MTDFSAVPWLRETEQRRKAQGVANDPLAPDARSRLVRLYADDIAKYGGAATR